MKCAVCDKELRNGDKLGEMSISLGDPDDPVAVDRYPIHYECAVIEKTKQDLERV